MAINPIAGAARYAALQPRPAASGPAAPAPKQTQKAEASRFEETLKSAVVSADTQQHTADQALQELASGESVDLHGTMIALEKADIALRTLVTVRDKVVSAYEQVMNMTI